MLLWSIACCCVDAHASEVILTPMGGAIGDGFGQSISVSGDWAIIGACRDDDMGSDAGAAYVFKFSNGSWIQHAKLIAGDGRPHDLFGIDVAISGNLAIVGAGNAKFGTGAAYVFMNNGGQWQQQAKLTPADGTENDCFGYSVDIDGENAVVGAYRNGAKGAESGAAYMFSNQSGYWHQVAKLIPSSGNAGDQFGRSVSVSDGWAAVGAMRNDQRGTDAGAVYFFQQINGRWTEKQRATASVAQSNAFFGFSVDVSGDWAIVGASAHDGAAADSGAVFMFQRSGGTWFERTHLNAPDTSAGGIFFGRSVAVSGNWAIIGADGHDGVAMNAGAAYLFQLNGGTWGYRDKLTAGNGGANDRYGWPIGISTDGSSIYHAAVGLHGDAGATESGAVYVYGGPSTPEIDVIPTELTIHQPPPASPVKSTYPKGTNGDLHPRGLIIPSDVIQYWKLQKRPPRQPGNETLPLSQDWSKDDSPVKSQGYCGSCSVFAAVALVENLGNRLGLPVYQDLSEQAVISCAARVSCVGGWPWDTFKFIQEVGIPPESCFPYEGSDSYCSNLCPYPEFLEKIDQFTPSPGLWGEEPIVDDLRAALQQGPLVVAMFLPDDGSFDRYSGGVYRYSGYPFVPGANNGHAVLLVGYDDMERSFLAKNSWGANWGESGYFRISYDEVEGSMRFGSYASTASGVYLEGVTSTFAIYNRGSAPLSVSELDSNRTWLNVSPNQEFSVEANESQVVSVTVDWGLMPAGGDSGKITVHSNDSDEPAVAVTVNAVPFGLNKGETSLANVDGKDGTNLLDAILALKILAGDTTVNKMIIDDYENSGADVGADGRIGFEEVIYTLQWVAELRKNQ